MMMSLSTLLIFLICIAVQITTATKPRSRDDLISKIMTQVSQDGEINEENDKFLQKIMKSSGRSCRPVPFKQTIRNSNCTSQLRVIDNRICFGSCLSRTDPMVGGERNKTVTICTPSVVLMREVIFDECKDGKNHMTPVQIVESCECKVGNGN